MSTRSIKITRDFSRFIGLSGLIVIMFLALPVLTGDTYELIEGSNNFFNCLQTYGKSECVNLERFGFTPHFISALFLEIYPNKDVVIVLWSLLSFISFLIIINIFFKFFYSIESKATSNIFFMGIIFSPMAAYGVYSFSEITFVLITLIYLILSYQHKYFLAFLPGILAISYKDNAFILVIPLAIIMILIQSSNKKPYIYLFLTSILGLSINFYFNFLRFGNFFQGSYQETGVVVDFDINLNHLLAIWFSPSGGVIGYFFLLPLLLLFYLIKNLKLFNYKQRLPVVILILPLFLTSINLALWFSPFGWIAWGPRLFLPTLILFCFSVFLFLKSQNLSLDDLLNPLINYFYFGVTFLMFTSVAGFLVNPGIWNTWYQRNLESGAFCKTIPLWEDDPAASLECTDKMIWTIDSLPLQSINEVFSSMKILVSSNFQSNFLLFALLCAITTYLIITLVENIQLSKKR